MRFWLAEAASSELCTSLSFFDPSCNAATYHNNNDLFYFIKPTYPSTNAHGAKNLSRWPCEFLRASKWRSVDHVRSTLYLC
jgi:hypothetical protein